LERDSDSRVDGAEPREVTGNPTAMTNPNTTMPSAPSDILHLPSSILHSRTFSSWQFALAIPASWRSFM
jgi:hypothetical protein